MDLNKSRCLIIAESDDSRMQKFQMNDKNYVQESPVCLLQKTVHVIIIIVTIIFIITIIIIICLHSLQDLSFINNHSVVVK